MCRVTPDKLQLYRARRSDPVALSREAARAAVCAAQPGFEIVAMPQGTTVEDVLQNIEQGQKRMDKEAGKGGCSK